MVEAHHICNIVQNWYRTKGSSNKCPSLLCGQTITPIKGGHLFLAYIKVLATWIRIDQHTFKTWSRDKSTIKLTKFSHSKEVWLLSCPLTRVNQTTTLHLGIEIWEALHIPEVEKCYTFGSELTLCISYLASNFCMPLKTMIIWCYKLLSKCWMQLGLKLWSWQLCFKLFSTQCVLAVRLMQLS